MYNTTEFGCADWVRMVGSTACATSGCSMALGDFLGGRPWTMHCTNAGCTVSDPCSKRRAPERYHSIMCMVSRTKARPSDTQMSLFRRYSVRGRIEWSEDAVHRVGSPVTMAPGCVMQQRESSSTARLGDLVTRGCSCSLALHGHEM